jgi:YesN/AraC family two-component response regulator
MKPYKIFVIDDEPMIVKGLKQMVPWEEIQCKVCGSARNGEEGVAKIEEVKPDIVISDIRMPKLSGLQMIEKLKDANQGMKFIILTGHRDFDYARKAIDLGVIRYLLKPTNIEDIKSAVVEAVSMLDDERSMEADILKLREKLKEATQALNVQEGHGEKTQAKQDLSKKNEMIGDSDLKSDEGLTDKKDGGKEHKVKYLAVKAVSYMKENYYNKLDLQTVADYLMISTWYLCKVLKQELDNSFVQLLNEIRIQEAKKLLVESNLKVYEICEEVGYTDNPYFTKTFKKYTGMTPNQYRNSQYDKSSSV